MTALKLGSVLLCAAALASCSDSTAASGSNDAGSDFSAASVDLAGGGADLSGAADGAPAIDLATAETGGQCPKPVGTYSVSASGQGCGDLNANAPQCIGNVGMPCVAYFQSVPPTGGAGAINGQAMLQPDGSFTNASLIFGTIYRTGCTGTWDAATSMLIADCGGMGSSQSCVVTLLRTATSCP
jgi:hypothetical protein